MAAIDIIILILLGVGAVLGFMKGFIKQSASLVGLIAGLLAARALYIPFAEKLCPSVTESTTVAQCIAFILIWIAVPVGFSFISSVLTKVIEAVSLGWLNRLLGVGLGLLKYMLLIGIFINVIQYIDFDNRIISETKKQNSVLYYPINNLAGIFFPTIKNVALQYIH